MVSETGLSSLYYSTDMCYVSRTKHSLVKIRGTGSKTKRPRIQVRLLTTELSFKGRSGKWKVLDREGSSAELRVEGEQTNAGMRV